MFLDFASAIINGLLYILLTPPGCISLFRTPHYALCGSPRASDHESVPRLPTVSCAARLNLELFWFPVKQNLSGNNTLSSKVFQQKKKLPKSVSCIDLIGSVGSKKKNTAKHEVCSHELLSQTELEDYKRRMYGEGFLPAKDPYLSGSDDTLAYLSCPGTVLFLAPPDFILSFQATFLCYYHITNWASASMHTIIVYFIASPFSYLYTH